jgi:hypothetical protein
MSKIRAATTFSNAVALIALFVALGGSAYAAGGNPFVGASGSVQGCVRKGVLDVVKAGKPCSKHTTSLAFDEAGAQGIQGTQGPAGAAGATGASGERGLSGPGAIPIVGNESSGTASETIATIGPWTVSLACSSSSSPVTTLTITGPSAIYVTSGFTGSSTGTPTPFSSSLFVPYTSTVADGALTTESGGLTSVSIGGTPAYEITLEQYVWNISECSVTGDAIEVG